MKSRKLVECSSRTQQRIGIDDSGCGIEGEIVDADLADLPQQGYSVDFQLI